MAREDLNEADFPELREGQMDMENETILGAHHQSRNGPGKITAHKEVAA